MSLLSSRPWSEPSCEFSSLISFSGLTPRRRRNCLPMLRALSISNAHSVTVLCGNSAYGATVTGAAPPVKIVHCRRSDFQQGQNRPGHFLRVIPRQCRDDEAFVNPGLIWWLR